MSVSYKQKFSDSSDKAHTRFIATKIYQDMEKHRASVETSPTTSRRWVWELIQNAKDVNIDGKVRVHIDADLEDPDVHVTLRNRLYNLLAGLRRSLRLGRLDWPVRGGFRGRPLGGRFPGFGYTLLGAGALRRAGL